MAYLILSREGEVITRFPLELERIIIGRDTDCEIPLEDAAISRSHCELTWDGRKHHLPRPVTRVIRQHPDG